MEAQAAKDSFKQQLRSMMKVETTNNPTTSIGNSRLMGKEELEFQQTKQEITNKMIAYMKEQVQRGSLNKYEASFLKGGVVFKPIKLAVYGMRADELEEKEHLIKSRKFLVARPVSAGSARSKGSGFSMGSHGPHSKQ